MAALKGKVMIFITIVLGLLFFLPLIADLLFVYVRGSWRTPLLYWNHGNASWVSSVAVILFFLTVFLYWWPRRETREKECRRKSLEAEFKSYFSFMPDPDPKLREIQQAAVNKILVMYAEAFDQADKKQREINEKSETPILFDKPEYMDDFLKRKNEEKKGAEQAFEQARHNFWPRHDCAGKIEFLVVLPKFRMYLNPDLVAQTLIS